VLPQLVARLAAALVDEPPSLLKDGNVSGAGHDAVVDEPRRLADGGKDEILAIEQREQRGSGISSSRSATTGIRLLHRGHQTHLPRSGALHPAADGRDRRALRDPRSFAELEGKVLTAEDTWRPRGRAVPRRRSSRSPSGPAGRSGRPALPCSTRPARCDRGGSPWLLRPTVDDGLVLDITTAATR